MAEDLVDDIAELRVFLSESKRPAIRGILSEQLQKLEKKLAFLQKDQERRLEKEVLSKPSIVATAPNPDLKKPAPPPKEFVPIRTAAAATEVRYTNLSKLKWDQDGERVRIYVTVDCGDDEIPEEHMVVSFAPWSFDVKLHDINGENYRYGLKRLNREIVPERCRCTIKPGKILIVLKKAEADVDWTALYFKETLTEEEEKRPPMAKLLEMMRHMYDDGDDEMRNTISSAWTTYRDGEDRKRRFQIKKANK